MPIRGALAGVWAEENSRDAIFESLRRKEVFGTSGTRIRPRLFAVWDFAEEACENDAPKTIQEMAWTSPIWYLPPD